MIKEQIEAKARELARDIEWSAWHVSVLDWLVIMAEWAVKETNKERYKEMFQREYHGEWDVES